MITTSTNRFIKRREVQALTSLSTSELYRRMNAGTFPAQINLGPKAVAWLESEILKWIDERVASRSTNKNTQ